MQGWAVGWGADGGAGWDPSAVQSHGMVGLEPSGRALEGRVRAEGGDGRRDAMTTFWGFPGNQGRHSNCITPVRISDFRWKACSPL